MALLLQIAGDELFVHWCDPYKDVFRGWDSYPYNACLRMFLCLQHREEMDIRLYD
jgi:hypothetical protein